MKKKTACIIVFVLIVANLFLSPATVPNNQSQLSLVLLEARADEGGENDPPDPGDEYPPLRPSPSDWTKSAITGYSFLNH